MLDWEWYGHPDMVTLWMHLLLSAAYKECCVRIGYKYLDVNRGQLVTNRRKLARETGLSERQIRTCLCRLKASQEVTIKTTHKFSVITICNYDIYQSQNLQSDPQSDPQYDPQSDPHKEEYKEYNNNLVCDARARLEGSTIQNSLWLNKTSIELRCPNVMQLAADVMDEWELTQLPETEWTVQHLFNHMRKKLDIRKREGKQSKLEAKEARRAQLKRDAINDFNDIRNGNYQQQTERNGVDRQAR